MISIPISRISRKGLPQCTPISKYFWPISDIMIDIIYEVDDAVRDIPILRNPILSVQNHTNQSAKK
jgi:hypothetical protein